MLHSLGATALLVQETEDDLLFYCWTEDNPTGEKLLQRREIERAALRIIEKIRRGMRGTTEPHDRLNCRNVPSRVEFSQTPSPRRVCFDIHVIARRRGCFIHDRPMVALLHLRAIRD